ncbi:CinA family protein, partial [Lysinibacillus sp. D4A3_S15]|uniref:CinA family protein n=1 Tax=Lysinibacillus sp. D4A3_S15 TaxID=2941227 RepID=UPI0020BD642D
GVVTYAKEAKVKQLGISQKLIDTHGVVSGECAATMASAIRTQFGTNIGIGLTGEAVPTAHDHQTVGTVWIGIAIN